MEYIQKFFEQLKQFLTWWVILSPWEKGIRVRFGKKVKMLEGGIYFKLPVFDRVYVQTIRSRNVSSPIQTISSLDGVAVSISLIIQYSINDVYKLYNTLYHPEMTIQNIIIGKVSNYIISHNIKDCNMDLISKEINNSVQLDEYGITLENINISTYAIVKTIRLIQDQSWLSEGYTLNEIK